jgi:dihydroneopterin aldolase
MPTPPLQRTVLVTGAARRLGRAFSLAFARAGWNVACHYQHSREEALRTCAEVEALGRRAWAIAGDLANTAAIERAFAELTQAIGGVPGAIVNNASLFEPDTGADFSPVLLQRQMQVNLLAPLQLGTLLARAASQPAAGQPVPVVLHVLDQKVFNLNPDYFSYTLSKLALERAVALQAQALAPRVRVNGIAPGLVYVSGPQTGDNFERARSVNLLRSPIDPTTSHARPCSWPRTIPSRASPSLWTRASTWCPWNATSCSWPNNWRPPREPMNTSTPPDPMLGDCRRIFLRGLTRHVRIGVHDFERVAAQRIIFDIDLYVPLADNTPRNDRIDEVVNYDFVRDEVTRIVTQGHIDLQETLCDTVLAAMLAHPQVVAARVSTRKPDVYDDCDAVGVETFRQKPPRP